MARGFIAGLMALTVFAIFFASPAFADGLKLPEKTYRELPKIPKQQALISYRDGVETLIIESSLDAEGQAFGWIIPVPSEPLEFGEVDPMLLGAVSKRTEPEIVHDVSMWVLAIFFLLFVIVLDHIVYKKSLVTAFAESTILVLLIFLVVSTLTSTFGSNAKPVLKNADLLVKNRVDVGSYGLAVLEAANPGALNHWLYKNGFSSIPKAGDKIVEDYIKDGWRFVAVKLKRDGNGFSTPHPIMMKFNAKAPVYPMRLTALAGSDVYLKLFVCAEGTAKLDGLKLEFSDRFDLTSTVFPIYTGRVFGQSIVNPNSQVIFGHGCVLTRYAGSISPKDMENDIDISFTGENPYIRKYYSRKGALLTALEPALWFWCFGVLFMFIANRKGRSEKGWRIHTLKLMIIPNILASIFIFDVTYLSLEKINVSVSPGIEYRYLKHIINDNAEKIKSYHSETGRYPAPGPIDSEWKDVWQNPFYLKVFEGRPEYFDVISYGKDGLPGGDGEDADVSYLDLKYNGRN